MRAIARERAPDMTGGWGELLQGARAGWHLRHLGRADRAEFAALMLKSLGDFLDARFENTAFKGVHGFKGLVGNMASPYATGSAYVLLHHVFGEVNGRRGKWGQPRGGMGAITQAMQRSLEARGSKVLLGQGVREVIVERGRAGVRERAAAHFTGTFPASVYSRSHTAQKSVDHFLLARIKFAMPKHFPVILPPPVRFFLFFILYGSILRFPES